MKIGTISGPLSSDPTSALHAAYRLLPVLNGVGNISIRKFEPIDILTVAEADSDLKIQHTYVKLAPNHNYIPHRLDQGLNVDWIFQLADTDSAVRQAMEVLSSGHPIWDQLYKLFEIIREDVSPTVLHSYGSKADFKTFTGSANHPAVSGCEGRHAVNSGAAPKKTMNAHKAQVFMRDVLFDWLIEKKQVRFPGG